MALPAPVPASDPSPRRVFVTGGTGLIGSHVAEQLRERGDAVRALVRPGSGTGHLESLGCELVAGDMMDDVADQAARIRGCDAVVHAAARVFHGGSRSAFLRANVDGTVRVLRAAAVSAPRVVHLSSVAVYAGLPMDRLTEARWTEADPTRQGPYPASKHLSERAAWGLHRAGDIRLTTVRPCVVYGERDRAATPIMVRYATLPLVPLPGGGRTRLPLVYAGNVARAVIAGLDRDRAIGRSYNAAQDHAIDAATAVALLRRELEGGRGRRPRTLTVPAAPLRAAAGAADVVARLLPWTPRGGLRRAIRALTTDNPYDSDRARLELGWTNLVSHEEGIRRTMEWWRSRESA